MFRGGPGSPSRKSIAKRTNATPGRVLRGVFSFLGADSRTLGQTRISWPGRTASVVLEWFLMTGKRLYFERWAACFCGADFCFRIFRSSCNSPAKRCRKGLSARSSSSNASARVKVLSSIVPSRKRVLHVREISCSVSNLHLVMESPGDADPAWADSPSPGWMLRNRIFSSSSVNTLIVYRICSSV